MSNPAKNLGDYYHGWDNGIQKIKNQNGNENIIKRIGKMLLKHLLPTGNKYE
ncbi:hypothetical protein HQ585_15655 [candidate division KSB1 bacterium]|nr:hypothetical protein [candidate division KSB1 bacterium]